MRARDSELSWQRPEWYRYLNPEIRRSVGSGTKARILDTRKTAPGLRVLDIVTQYAAEEDRNHAWTLSDGCPD